MSESHASQSRQKLRLTEIFYSLQGETRTMGIPTVFIRLTGCPLRCSYCDTEYAFSGGDWWDFDTIVRELEKYKTRYVTVTGGEPLAQKSCYDLLTLLVEQDYKVSLETSGAMDVSKVDPRVTKILDLKTPGSGEMERNLLTNLDHLNGRDQVKFVLCDRADYEWAVVCMREHQLPEHCEVIFSPVYGRLDLRQLAEWVLADQLAVRVQTQLHKLIWGNEPGR